MSASAGMLSTLVLVTTRPELALALWMRLRKRVAPIALEPMPASQAKTILWTLLGSAGPMDSAAAAAMPRASAFISCICSWASARFLPVEKRRMTAEPAKETPAAMMTPSSTGRMASRGAMAM